MLCNATSVGKRSGGRGGARKDVSEGNGDDNDGAGTVLGKEGRVACVREGSLAGLGFPPLRYWVLPSAWCQAHMVNPSCAGRW